MGDEPLHQEGRGSREAPAARPDNDSAAVPEAESRGFSPWVLALKEEAIQDHPEFSFINNQQDGTAPPFQGGGQGLGFWRGLVGGAWGGARCSGRGHVGGARCSGRGMAALPSKGRSGLDE